MTGKRRGKTSPQGLKPSHSGNVFGTSEVAPFHKTDGAKSLGERSSSIRLLRFGRVGFAEFVFVGGNGGDRSFDLAKVDEAGGQMHAAVHS